MSEPKLRWYVIQTTSGEEKRIKETLRELIARHPEHKEAVGEIVVPAEEVVEMRAGQKRKSERKLFPGYVLIQMVMSDELWHLIRRVPKVSFVGTSRGATPITDREAAAIIDRVKQGEDKPRPKVLYEPGEVVRVNEGPFSDFTGVVEEVNYEKNWVRVSVSIFGRSTPVELKFDQVEKA